MFFENVIGINLILDRIASRVDKSPKFLGVHIILLEPRGYFKNKI